MGFLDKAKAVAEQAASKAKESVEDVQVKRELGQAYDDLGKQAFELIESGALTHPALEEAAAKVRALIARAAANDEDDAPPAEAAPAEPSEPAATT